MARGTTLAFAESFSPELKAYLGVLHLGERKQAGVPLHTSILRTGDSSAGMLFCVCESKYQDVMFVAHGISDVRCGLSLCGSELT